MNQGGFMNSHLNKITLAAIIGLSSFVAVAQSKVRILPHPGYHALWTQNEVNQIALDTVDVNLFREVRVQIFADHLVLQLVSDTYHKVEFVRLDIDEHHTVLAAYSAYKYTEQELKTQDVKAAAACPDPSVQFIAFCPNNVPVEQQVTADVINAAQAKGYKVVSLLNQNATRSNYMAYMSCPNLVGNFYDGDASPDLFTTFDGVISASEIGLSSGLFRHQVTNIWVACEAYNDPMLSAVTVTAQSQKYAAGINDLLVGPSDEAAACTMKAAIAGSPMTQAFQDCYKQLDTADDHWGFGGSGSDIFASH
jgi:hypothetical protein